MRLLWFLMIGAVAGWLAGKITRGRGFGLLMNLIVGVCGAMVGGLLFGLVGMTAVGLIGELFTATVGAIVFLFVLRKLKQV
ncbi:MAG: GlsB/YeaQ/YmgE family stress response membrane protein [Planctomycetaceae bacterium]